MSLDELFERNIRKLREEIRRKPLKICLESGLYEGVVKFFKGYFSKKRILILMREGNNKGMIPLDLLPYLVRDVVDDFEIPKEAQGIIDRYKHVSKWLNKSEI